MPDNSQPDEIRDNLFLRLLGRFLNWLWPLSEEELQEIRDIVEGPDPWEYRKNEKLVNELCEAVVSDFDDPFGVKIRSAMDALRVRAEEVGGDKWHVDLVKDAAIALTSNICRQRRMLCQGTRQDIADWWYGDIVSLYRVRIIETLNELQRKHHAGQQTGHSGT